MKLALLLAVCLVACTAHHDVGSLVNGYQLRAMNPAEVYVAKADGELVLGPTVEKLGVKDDLIVAYCGLEERSVNGFANTVGYNIIDTKTGEISKHLTEQQMRQAFQTQNLSVPKLDSPQKYFR